MVTSHIRIGEGAFSPLIMPGQADMVLALEIHEALRGLSSHLKDGGILVYYNVSLQPLKRSPWQGKACNMRRYNQGMQKTLHQRILSDGKGARSANAEHDNTCHPRKGKPYPYD